MFTAHIPNGVGNGWKKIDTLNARSAELSRTIDSPRILTGDLNQPEWHPTLGTIVVFGDGKGAPERWTDQFGDERPYIEWANGVRSVLDDAASQHRLRDAYRQVRRGPEETPLSRTERRREVSPDASTIPSAQDISMSRPAAISTCGVSGD